MTMIAVGAESRWDGVEGSLAVRRPAPGVVVLTLSGTDVGEFGEAPFSSLATVLAECRTIELFIDARGARGATTDVSADWARWLGENRERFTAIRMLTGSRFIQISAEFVRKFAGLGARMCVYTEPRAFEDELSAACAAS